MNKKKAERFFRSRNRLLFEGAVYHITQRAPGKEPLFLEEADYLYMLHLMKTGVKKFGYDAFAFVLMLNHIHLLARINKANLAQAMKSLFEAYARYFNKKYERKGPVFCRPYRAALCLTDSYLLAASVYIHLNPVKAGVVKDASEYRWSSYSAYVQKKDVAAFINYKFVLGILNADIDKAREGYIGMMGRTKDFKAPDVLENRKGLDVFHSAVLPFMGAITPKEKQANPNENLLDDTVLEAKIAELVSHKRLRNPKERQARKFLVEQLLSRGYSVIEIAKKLNVTRTSVYNTLNLTG